MTALAEPATLLAVWERAAGAPAAARAAVLVHGAGLVGELDEALDLDLGRCAALASQAYREEFGTSADAVTVCGECGELIEATVPAGGVGPTGATGEANRPAPTGPQVRELVVGDWVVRAATTRDLLLAAGEPDAVAASLLSRCVRHRETGQPPGALPAQVLADLDEAAEELAGAGSLVSVVTCPACSASVEVGLDAGALLWESVASAGIKLLTEVATLAAAFGWSEAEILALSPERRRAYLTFASP